MTRIKLCGLCRPEDIEAANQLRPDYIGFVFAPESRRYVAPDLAEEWRRMLAPEIQAVGVFVNEAPERVAELLNSGVIDAAQLHGAEDEVYLKRLRSLSPKPIIQAFRVRTPQDAAKAEQSSADYVLLDSGAGTGRTFDWELIRSVKRPFFLAGGLDSGNVTEAVRLLHPFGVDVSSGIETNGVKDKIKMAAFVAAVRKEEEQ
ncbi:MAG: phosphoribosylanthranilate isomerase [Acutalibacter sp.]|jgi:phosphoribosylanthranilate isomerase